MDNAKVCFTPVRIEDDFEEIPAFKGHFHTFGERQNNKEKISNRIGIMLGQIGSKFIRGTV